MIHVIAILAFTFPKKSWWGGMEKENWCFVPAFTTCHPACKYFHVEISILWAFVSKEIEIPDGPFHNFRDSKSGDRRVLCIPKCHTADFETQNLLKGRSGILLELCLQFSSFSSPTKHNEI